MTRVKKVSQRGLVAVVIMLPLILAFYSHADALPRIVPIPCGGDIDQIINGDDRDTPSRFVLAANCSNPFVASATIVPSNGDEVACAVAPTFVQRGRAAQDPTTKCTVAGSASVENVFRPIGKGGTTATVRFEGIKITGGNYTGSSGSGAGIAEGSMTDSSYHYGIEVMNNDAAGILSAKGTFDRVEFTNNTLVSGALGVIGAAIKARNEVEVKNSYVHDTQGNGLWCDNECADANTANGKFWIHDNLVVNAGRGGIRWEGVSLGEALIQYNEIYGNSYDASRGGVSIRDAKDAEVKNNTFGSNANRVAIIASASGKSGRPPLRNIDIWGNNLNGEIIKGCELPDDVVDCTP